MVWRTADVTDNTFELLILAERAVIVVEPVNTVLTCPLGLVVLLGSSLTVAIAGYSETQLTDSVMLAVVPSP